MYAKILSWAASKGPKFVKTVKNNSGRILEWINNGASFIWITDQIDAMTT